MGRQEGTRNFELSFATQRGKEHDALQKGGTEEEAKREMRSKNHSKGAHVAEVRVDRSGTAIQRKEDDTQRTKRGGQNLLQNVIDLVLEKNSRK